MKQSKNSGYYIMHWFFLFALPPAVFLLVYGVNEFTRPGLAIGFAALIFILYVFVGIDGGLFVPDKNPNTCPHCGKGIAETPE